MAADPRVRLHDILAAIAGVHEYLPALEAAVQRMLERLGSHDR
jgi:hypothetical protein